MSRIMKHALAAVLVLLLGAGLFAVGAHVVAAEKVYTVADLHAVVAHDPRVWMGRTVLVQGRAVAVLRSACLPAAWCTIGLIGPGTPARAAFLPLAPGPADPFLAFLRRVPLVGRVVPGPQQLSWGKPAIYRVRLRAIPLCAGANCYDALLLDAAPFPVYAGGTGPSVVTAQ